MTETLLMTYLTNAEAYGFFVLVFVLPVFMFNVFNAVLKWFNKLDFVKAFAFGYLTESLTSLVLGQSLYTMEIYVYLLAEAVASVVLLLILYGGKKLYAKFIDKDADKDVKRDLVAENKKSEEVKRESAEVVKAEKPAPKKASTTKPKTVKKTTATKRKTAKKTDVELVESEVKKAVDKMEKEGLK